MNKEVHREEDGDEELKYENDKIKEVEEEVEQDGRGRGGRRNRMRKTVRERQ